MLLQTVPHSFQLVDRNASRGFSEIAASKATVVDDGINTTLMDNFLRGRLGLSLAIAKQGAWDIQQRRRQGDVMNPWVVVLAIIESLN